MYTKQSAFRNFEVDGTEGFLCWNQERADEMWQGFSKDMRKSANEIARKILDENTEPVITREQTKEINAMANSYHKKALERLIKSNE